MYISSLALLLDRPWIRERSVTTKSVPPKIGPAGPILAAKTGPLLPKLVPHRGPILAKIYLPKLIPPQRGAIIVCVDGCMDIAIATIASYLKIMDS